MATSDQQQQDPCCDSWLQSPHSDDSCTVLYYIKQLSPSDAACSKQIKLPKTEARRFVGDLRHKQRSVVTVLDHRQVAWEFLCTCYGCQYALSRVAVFCNTYQLYAGQYLMFYRDALKRLEASASAVAALGGSVQRIAVSSSIPDALQQPQRNRKAAQHRSSPSPVQPLALLTDTTAATAPAFTQSTAALPGMSVPGLGGVADQLIGCMYPLFDGSRTKYPDMISMLSTDNLRRSSSTSSGVDSDQSCLGSQGSRDSSSEHLTAAAVIGAWPLPPHQGGGDSCKSSSQQWQQLVPAGFFTTTSRGEITGGNGSEGTWQQLLLKQAAQMLPHQRQEPQVKTPDQQETAWPLVHTSSSGLAAVTEGSSKLIAECALVCHEQLMESPPCVACTSQQHSFSEQQQQQGGQRDHWKQSCCTDIAVTITAAQTTADSAEWDIHQKGRSRSDQDKAVEIGASSKRSKTHHQQQRQVANIRPAAVRPILNLAGEPGCFRGAKAAAVAGDVQQVNQFDNRHITAAAVGRGGLKRTAEQMDASVPATKRTHPMTDHGFIASTGPPAVAAAVHLESMFSKSSAERALAAVGAADSSSHPLPHPGHVPPHNTEYSGHADGAGGLEGGSCGAGLALNKDFYRCNIVETYASQTPQECSSIQVKQVAAVHTGVPPPAGTSVSGVLDSNSHLQQQVVSRAIAPAAAAAAAGLISGDTHHLKAWPSHTQQQHLATVTPQHGSMARIAASQGPSLFQPAAVQPAAAIAAAAGTAGSSGAAAATWRAPPKLQYKHQQQMWHKLQQQQEHPGQPTASSTKHGMIKPALCLDDDSSEWAAVWGLLMLSRD